MPDIQGSVIASLDASSGVLTKTGYQPYGESNMTAGVFRYTGARIDAETSGLYDFRARMYSPVLGRFMQTDPIGTAGGVNLYAYVNNDPLNGKDPTGFLGVWGIVGFVGGPAETTIGVGFVVVSGWTGVGAIACAAVALHGIDVAQAAFRDSNTVTSQGLQAVGLSQGTANAINSGISGAAFIAAGSPILPYSLFGPAVSGGGAGTSLISATARGFVFPGVEVSNATSNIVLDALQGLYGTGTNAAAVGRAASSASVAIGSAMEASGAIQGGLISEAQGATVNSGQLLKSK